MKLVKFFLITFLAPLAGLCQNIDSLEALVKKHTKEDTARVNILTELAFELRGDDIIRSRALAEESLKLARRLKYPSGEVMSLVALAHSNIRAGDVSLALQNGRHAVELSEQISDSYFKTNALWTLGFIYFRQGDYSTAIQNLKQAQASNRNDSDLRAAAITLQVLGRCYENIGDYSTSLQYALQSLNVSKKANYRSAISFSFGTIGNTYSLLGDYEQALNYLHKALNEAELGRVKRAKSFVLNSIGETYRMQGNYAKAIEAYEESIKVDENTHDTSSILANKGSLSEVYERLGKHRLAFRYAREALESIGDSAEKSKIQITLARAYLHTNKPDSALYYGKVGLAGAQKIGRKGFSRDACQIISEIYLWRNDYANAYRYQILYSNYKDSIASDQAARRAALVQYQSDLDKKQSEIDLLSKNSQLQTEAARRQKQLLIVSLGGVLLLSLSALALVRSNRQKNRNNIQLIRLNEQINGQKEEIVAQRDDLEQTLTKLKSAQAQLVQSEKMASLGELTAGIAHEIQNPLNFINNFSEVNKELLQEMHDEIEKGNMVEVRAIAMSLIDNEEKINHHGKRAEGIVKGMLQHSRKSSGVKEPTDINALADEYLRLAYHGLRAKDKSFNATIKTEFDQSIGKIDVIPQDIGRVILNLITNAFYAVDEKRKHGPETYGPTVSVLTKRIDNKIQIAVRDNGDGIPTHIIDKIFQPFFTTKPTGQGTGLGLSMSYDIITKTHGGELKVNTREGEYAEFKIILPA